MRDDVRTGLMEPESKGTLATTVYEQLRSDLLSGRLEPDSKLRVEWVVSGKSHIILSETRVESDPHS